MGTARAGERERERIKDKQARMISRAVLTEARVESECLRNFSISINPCLLGVAQLGGENVSIVTVR